jgi:translocation and assembly module TamB
MGDGHVDLLGSLSDGGQWQGSAKLTGINPATLDERFAVSLVGGDVVVSQNLDGLAFDAHLQSSSAIGGAGMAKKQPAWMVKEFRAKGLWTAPRLQLDAFNLEVPDAQLRGSLQFDRNTWSASGHVAGVVPGARVKIDGGISSDRGQGDMVLELSDAGQLATWLSRWPGASGWKDSIRKFDHAAAKLHWDGGWQAFTLTSGGQVLRGTLDAGWELKSQGRRTTDGAWEAHVDALQLYALVRGERWALQTNQSVALSWVPDGASRRIQVAEGSAQLSGPRPGAVQLIWQPAQWSQKLQNDANGGAWQWACRGQLKNLPLDWLTNLASATASKIGLEGDMVLGGQWDASGQDGALQLRASLERARGDIEISADELGNAPLKAGVRDASLNLSILNENVQAQLNWDSAAAGVAHASATTRLEHQASGWSWPPDAALEGRFQAQLPRLRVWSMLAPPGWRLTGTLDADAQLSGSRSAPRWKGILLARELSVRSVLDGVDFSKGAMRINMDGDGLDIAEFTLQGASAGPVSGGTLSLTGSVRWPEEDAATQVTSRLRMNLQATAKDLRVSTRADQRLVVSGKVFAALENAILEVTGALTADQASFVLSEESTPKLGNDVRVRGAPTAQGTVASPLGSRGASFGKSVEPRVNVTLDLGPNFQVQGYGLNTRLGGKLELATTHEFVPRLTGQIHTVSGTYKAYGQQLDIEAGELRFDGSFDNPGLDILAIRPNIVQRVGVQMGGTALLPVVRLYAEPDLPDAEKLSWLVVGHANADGSAQMAMLQQAAMTMVSRDGQPLTSGLANAIGLDEISMGGLGTNGGSATATGATVKLGKRLAGNFYVAYEHSVAGAYGTFYIFYDLSKRFTLRGQTGKQSAADLIFTARYD